MKLQTLLSALRKCEREHGSWRRRGTTCNWKDIQYYQKHCDKYTRLAQKLEARIVGMFADAENEGFREGYELNQTERDEAWQLGYDAAMRYVDKALR